MLCTRSGAGTITVDGRPATVLAPSSRPPWTIGYDIAMLLEMAAEGAGQRTALGSRSGGLSYAELLRGAGIQRPGWP